MQYSILLAALRTGPDVLESLQALRQAMEQGPLRGELILAMAQPRDGLSAIDRTHLDRWADRIHFDDQNNKARALNSAVLAARGTFVVFTEAGARPGPNWLGALLDPLTADDSPWAASAGPIQPLFQSSQAPLWVRTLLAGTPSHAMGPIHSLPADQTEYQLRTGVDPLPFATNLAARQEICVTHPFHEDMLPRQGEGLRSGEDTRFALELLLQNHRITHQPEARVSIPLPPRRFALAYARAVGMADGRGRGLALEEFGPWHLERIRETAIPPIQQPTQLDRANRKALNELRKLERQALTNPHG